MDKKEPIRLFHIVLIYLFVLIIPNLEIQTLYYSDMPRLDPDISESTIFVPILYIFFNDWRLQIVR